LASFLVSGTGGLGVKLNISSKSDLADDGVVVGVGFGLIGIMDSDDIGGDLREEVMGDDVLRVDVGWAGREKRLFVDAKYGVKSTPPGAAAVGGEAKNER